MSWTATKLANTWDNFLFLQFCALPFSFFCVNIQSDLGTAIGGLQNINTVAKLNGNRFNWPQKHKLPHYDLVLLRCVWKHFCTTGMQWNSGRQLAYYKYVLHKRNAQVALAYHPLKTKQICKFTLLYYINMVNLLPYKIFFGHTCLQHISK